MPITYDKNVDYKALMNAAIQAGDYKSAAKYEQQRNAKIAGEGITQYQQTHDLGSEYDAKHMTNAELGKAYKARQAYQSGKTDVDTSHDYVEKLRSSYGYSGGKSGSEYIPTPKTADGTKGKSTSTGSTGSRSTPVEQTAPRAPVYAIEQSSPMAPPVYYEEPEPDPEPEPLPVQSIPYLPPVQAEEVKPQPITYEPDPLPEPFTYEEAPVYVNRYQDLIDELRGKILDRDPFSYNAEADPLYQQYRSSYTRGGRRAMEDTLGQMASRTGGMASSYAESAAQQTYQNYMGALADRVPELRQLAYEMYENEGSKQRLNLDMISALEREDYGKYQDLLTQYNRERSFAYDQHRDRIADARYADRTAYDRAVRAEDTAYDRARYANETAYDRARYADETAYNRAVYADQRDYERSRDAEEAAYNRSLTAARTAQEAEQRAYDRAREAEQRAYDRAREAEERDYNRGIYADRTAYERDTRAEETAYNRGIYADENDYDRKLKKAKLLAESGDFSGYLELGFTQEELDRMQAAYLRQHPELAYLYQRTGAGGLGYNTTTDLLSGVTGGVRSRYTYSLQG